MRISTNTIYQTGSAQISKLQAALVKTKSQISANRRLLTPSDDPIASARALEVTQSQSLNTQYETNRGYATSSLSLEETVLSSVTSLIQDAQTQVVEAGNAAYDNTQRKYIATDLRGRLEELIGLANSQDSEGNYLFSGFQTGSKPFSQSTTGVDYDGDQGQRNLQVGSARQMSISDSGDAVFQHISSSGTFAIDVSAGTFGSGSISSASVTDETALTDETYTLTFADGGTTYSVTDSGGTVVVPLGTAYVDGDAIEFNGVKFTVSGTRVDGDELTVSTTAPSKSQSIFSTISDLIDLLETSANGVTGNTNLALGLAASSENLSNALDNLLTVRASVGSRLKELETLDSAGEDRDIQYAATLSKLQDLDYVKALSDLSMQKTTLEAAQQSYVKTMNLSLFDYL